MALVCSHRVELKLQTKHRVTIEEVYEAFADRPDYVVLDEREEHATDPPTVWFIASTNHGRLLKVVYVQKGPDVHLKTAYAPNDEEVRLFQSAT